MNTELGFFKNQRILSIIFVVFLLHTITIKSGYGEISVDSSSYFLNSSYSKKISMDFQDANLVDVLKIFSQQTNLNMICAEDVANKKVTVFFDNVPVEQALEQVLRANNLTYELQPDSNIFIVKTVSKPDTEMLTKVYILKHASVSGAKIRKTLKIVYTVGKDTETTLSDDESGGSGAGGETGGIMGALKTVLTPKGKIIEDTRTNSLTITDVASNFGNIENAVAKLDIPVPQVLIEAEMLEVSKETVDKIGIKYGESPLSFTGAERDVVYPWNQNRLLAKGFEFADAEYRVGTIAASGMTALLQFLTTQSDTKNLARPRILTLSNQPAQIKISTDEAVGLSTQTTSSQATSNTTNEAERVETGVFLTVTPQVDEVTQSVTMAIVPKVVTTVPSSITTNGVQLKDPEERGTVSLLRVKTGDTVVIGGLLREDRTTIVTKLPFLGDLPLVGGVFRHKNDTVENRELIIFLTPHIISNDSTLSAETQTAIKPILREQGQNDPRMKTINKALSLQQRKKM